MTALAEQNTQNKQINAEAGDKCKWLYSEYIRWNDPTRAWGGVVVKALRY